MAVHLQDAWLILQQCHDVTNPQLQVTARVWAQDGVLAGLQAADSHRTTPCSPPCIAVCSISTRMISNAMTTHCCLRFLLPVAAQVACTCGRLNTLCHPGPMQPCTCTCLHQHTLAHPANTPSDLPHQLNTPSLAQANAPAPVIATHPSISRHQHKENTLSHPASRQPHQRTCTFSCT
jgi:hypothetical protein